MEDTSLLSKFIGATLLAVTTVQMAAIPMNTHQVLQGFFNPLTEHMFIKYLQVNNKTHCLHIGPEATALE